VLAWTQKSGSWGAMTKGDGMKSSTIKSCMFLCALSVWWCPLRPLAADEATNLPSENAQLHGVAIPRNVAAYVQQKEPKKIELPYIKEIAGDIARKIEAAKDEKKENAFSKLIREIQDEKRGSFAFSDIPFISAIPLPHVVREFFGKIVMYLPVVNMTTKGFSVDGMIDYDKVRVWGRIAVESDSTGKKRYSLALELPKGWKFSDLFPKTDKFDPTILDLFVFERAYLVLSSAKYKDPTLKVDIREGLNFLANVRPTGKFFTKLNALTGGALKSIASLNMHGVIGLNEQLIGTMLEFELPVGLKLTSWLETSKLKFFIALEERITQTVCPSVGLSGGLKIKLPLQSEFIELRLTGKYTVPEDLELYGDMTGWLQNVPLKYMSLGDVRIGIMTDLSLIAESVGTVGWISGVNLAGGIGVVDSKLHVAVKGAIDGMTAIEDMTVIIDGTGSLKDMVAFWLYYAEDAAKLLKKDQKFAQAIIAKIPSCELKDVHFAFVPRETVEEKKRLEVSVGAANIFGLHGSGTFYLDKQGVRGKLFVPELIIGPRAKPILFISGAGEKGKAGFIIEVTANPLEQSIYADVTWGSSVLGGMTYSGRMNVNFQSIELNTTFKWANLVDTQLMVSAKMLSQKMALQDFSAHMKLQQSGQEMLVQILKIASKEMMGDLQKQLDVMKNKQLGNIDKTLVSREEKMLASIAQLEKQLADKKEACDKQFSGSKVGLRPLCYVWKNMIYDSIRLLAKKLQRDIDLNVTMVGGIVGVETVTGTTKIFARPIGAVMNFLADVLANAIVIRQFDAEINFKNLAENKPAIVHTLDMRIAGKDIKLKDKEVDIIKSGKLLIDLFDVMSGKTKK
jgi:hypothetical protein